MKLEIHHLGERVLYLAQNGLCFYCGKPMSPIKAQPRKGGRISGWTKDHLVPKSYVKSRKISLKFNTVLSHERCNQQKGARFPTKREVQKFKVVYRTLADMVNT